MPVPTNDAWREVQRTVRRVKQMPPRDGLTGGVQQRYPPYHGFVRVIGQRQPSGFYLGVVTEHDSAAGAFNDRLDVPVWVRTINYHVLTVGTAGDTDGTGVYWARGQDLVEISDELDTGTGADLLPEYVADDSGEPGPGEFGTGTSEDDPCIGQDSFFVTFYRCEEFVPPDTGTGTGVVTGTGTDAGKVSVACCPNAISPQLHLTLSSPPGSCTLEYDGVNGWWQGTGKYTSGLCSPAQQDFTARLRCGAPVAGGWGLRLCFGSGCDPAAGTCQFAESTSTLTEVSCDPLQLEFASGGVVTCPTCYSAAAAVSGTITEGMSPP